MTTKNKFIVKVQLPLFSSDGGNEALIYSEDRSTDINMELPPEVLAMMDEGEAGEIYDGMKNYFWAYNKPVLEKGKLKGYMLVITKRAPLQSW